MDSQPDREARIDAPEPLVFTEDEVRHLEAWLARRRGDFPRWAAAYGPDVRWDFSPESLDALGALAVRLTPTVRDFEDERNADFVDGASWYLGEALRRARGGRWCYRHGDPQVNLFDGLPYVEQADPGGESGVPLRALRVAVRRGDPGHLRRRYEAFAR